MKHRESRSERLSVDKNVLVLAKFSSAVGEPSERN